MPISHGLSSSVSTLLAATNLKYPKQSVCGLSRSENIRKTARREDVGLMVKGRSRITLFPDRSHNRILKVIRPDDSVACVLNSWVVRTCFTTSMIPSKNMYLYGNNINSSISTLSEDTIGPQVDHQSYSY